MNIYRHIKTGVTVETDSTVTGEYWELVKKKPDKKPDKKPTKPEGNSEGNE